MAALLGMLTLLLAGCSASGWERDLRFGFPTGITDQATRIRVLWTWAGLVALALGVVVWGLIFWAAIRYRKKDDRLPRQTKYNFVVEIICFTVPLIIIAGLFWRTVVVENYVNKLTKNPDVRVQVDAFKWNWQFEYHSYRDLSGKEHATFWPGTKAYSDASRNSYATGLLPNTPGHCDEAASNTSNVCGASGPKQNLAAGPIYLNTVGTSNEIPILVIPVNRTVRFVEHSEDVIHSFWVPEFLFKRDVIPYGTTSTVRDNQFEITAHTKGAYVGRCAELCGTYHSQMNFEVRVVPEAKFEAYLAALKRLGPDDPNRQSEALKAAGMLPYAVTTYPLDTNRIKRSASIRGSQPAGG
ncbi:MAG TPA: cytochrome c oxidase subunit II [Jatrophihabitans sp.]|nr:cytochrome c oxidase subunit II [Jatrophihabitans sp.]